MQNLGYLRSSDQTLFQHTEKLNRVAAFRLLRTPIITGEGVLSLLEILKVAPKMMLISYL
jgi:hypothetical protein